MHHRKRADGRQCIRQHVLFHTPRGGEHNRQHHHQSRVKENRETENQRSHPQRKRCAFLAKRPHQRIGQRLRAAGRFHQPPQHRAQADQQGHAAERAAEVFDQHVVDDMVHRQSRRHRRGQADQNQRQQRVDTELHNQHQNQQHRARGNAQERART